MKLFKYIYLFLTIFGITFLTSCDKGGEPVVEGTSTRKFSGDWFIKATDQKGNEVSGYHLYLSYNTSANDNTMWIDDWATRTSPTAPGNPAGYALRTKLTMDLNNGSFSAPKQLNLNNEPNTVIITDGLITVGAGLSKAGHKVDKIVFTGVFSDDPAGTIIKFEGHKRTGFFEDEY